MRPLPYILLTVAAACGPSEPTVRKSSTGASSGTGTTTTAGTTTAAGTGTGGASNEATELEGVWISNCHESQIVTRVFAGGTYTSSNTEYEDEACTVQSVLYSGKGSFLIGGAVASGALAKNIDMTLTATELTPVTAAAAKRFNDQSECGISDWQAGKTRTVQDCDLVGKAGTVYSVYTILNTAKGDKLSFGKASGKLDGSTAEKRHSDFDSNRSYSPSEP